MPSWPSSFSPQHLTVPPARRAQVWAEPAVTAETPPRPGTATGVGLPNRTLPPSWPESPSPQHVTVPAGNTTHPWFAPTASDVADDATPASGVVSGVGPGGIPVAPAGAAPASTSRAAPASTAIPCPIRPCPPIVRPSLMTRLATRCSTSARRAARPASGTGRRPFCSPRCDAASRGPRARAALRWLPPAVRWPGRQAAQRLLRRRLSATYGASQLPQTRTPLSGTSAAPCSSGIGFASGSTRSRRPMFGPRVRPLPRRHLRPPTWTCREANGPTCCCPGQSPAHESVLVPRCGG